ncbi:hypothetical protein Agub_g15100 [Astrephomene gubernaculifera]|uniref:Uncharacterized protein n=1 Tax=Astrephomene gubernaculifera TaxID=47775 RepID=A0AAD3E4L6_9CHLO|nr:hypothetical protein Agub_g15100 [Astrephomene gubernaculifera]
MSGAKKSVDEIWKELNAAKPKPRQGVAGLAVGLGGVPGITSLIRTKPAQSAATASPAPGTEKSKPQPDLQSSPYVASTVGDDAAAYLATIQRTINCLADPDRALRRSAATTLQTKLFTGDASTPRANPAQLQALLCGPLLRPLVTMLSDSVERCRTIGLAILLDGIRHLTDVSPMLPELLPELARRFGALPVQEPAEEVRLQIALLTATLLSAAPPTQMDRFAPDLASILCRGLEDGFPDIKKTACGAIETAAARLARTALEPEAERLLTSLAPNLQHQHSRVRLAAIQALDALVGSGVAPMALVEGTVVNALRPVGHDRAQPVREAAFAALARWMGYRQAAEKAAAGVAATDGQSAAADGGAIAVAKGLDSNPSVVARAYAPALLPLLLIGVTDPQPATAELALRLMEGVGEAWVGSGGGIGGSGGADGSAEQHEAPSEAVSEAPEAPADVGRPQPQRDAPEQATDPATASTAIAAASESCGDAVAALTATANGIPPQDCAASAAATEDAMAARVAACGLGPPYCGRPGHGCRTMVRDLLRQHLPPLVRQLGEWTSSLRVAAARGLHTTLVMAEEGASVHLRLLLPALCSAIADEELEVATYVMSCVHVLGAHVDPRDWMPRLLDSLASPPSAVPPPAVSGTSTAAGNGNSSNNSSGSGGDRGTAGAPSGGMSTSQRTHTLVVLSGLLHAAGRAQRELPPALLQRLAAALAEESMLTAAAEHSAVRSQLLAATMNALAWANGGGGSTACAAVALPLHVVLLHLYGSELAAAASQAAAPSPGTAAAASQASAGAAVSPVGTAALEAMATLASCCCCDAADADATKAADGNLTPAEGAAALAARHADWLMAALFGCPPEPPPSSETPPTPPAVQSLSWRPRPGDASWQCVLRGTLLTAAPDTLRRLAPALVSALGPVVSEREREAGLRLALLQLLDGVLEEPERGPALVEGSGQALLTQVLMPPLVWQAGKTAAAVRYAAMTALATLLGRRLPPPEHLLAALEGPGPGVGGAGAGTGAAAAPAAAGAAGGGQQGGGGVVGGAGGEGGGGLLPLLSSALDEEWYMDMRLVGCYVVEKMLELVGSRLSDASRRALYPELHKRLDDAHNSVRVAACGALRAFVAGAGGGYCDTNSGYLVAGVVIHMDDGDPAVQEAACSVLLAAAAAKPAVTAAEVRKVRERFRAKHYCDRVLAACAEAQAAEGQEAA